MDNQKRASLAQKKQELGFNPMLLGLMEAAHNIDAVVDNLVKDGVCSLDSVEPTRKKIRELKSEVSRLVGMSVVNGMWNIVNHKSNEI